MIRCGWRVSGKVQGVFFGKFTKIKADQLGLAGWCRNTPDGRSVEGEVLGTEAKVNQMLEWIGKEGSPNSRPQELVVLKREKIEPSEFDSENPKFEIRR